jgi:hypothetical protein
MWNSFEDMEGDCTVNSEGVCVVLRAPLDYMHMSFLPLRDFLDQNVMEE